MLMVCPVSVIVSGKKNSISLSGSSNIDSTVIKVYFLQLKILGKIFLKISEKYSTNCFNHLVN